MIRRVSALLVALAVAVALVGCGAEAKTVGGKPRTKVIKRIISLSPSLSEIIALNDPSLLVGRTSSCDYPIGSFANVPVVAEVKPDYEKVVAAQPELIIYDSTLFSEADIEKLKSVAKSAEVMPFEAKSVRGLIDWIVRFGAKTGGESTYSEYCDRIYASVARAKASPANGVKVAIITGGPAEGYFAAGTDSFLADVVRQTGAELVGPKSDKFAPINAEALTSLAPALILTSDKAEAVLADAKLGAVPAVRAKKVFGIRGDVLLRAGSRVHTLIDGISSLARDSQKAP